MNSSEQSKLAGMMAMYAGYYRQTLSDEVLKMYAGDLSDLDFEAVRQALESYRMNPKNRFMPLPAMIREILEPQVDPDSAAREIAARITAAIPKFGWSNPEAAMHYIGEIGWQCVKRQGGWSHICEHHGLSIDPSTFQAQVRELAKSAITHDSVAMAAAIKLGPGIKLGGLQSIQEMMSLPKGESQP